MVHSRKRMDLRPASIVFEACTSPLLRTRGWLGQVSRVPGVSQLRPRLGPKRAAETPQVTVMMLLQQQCAVRPQRLFLQQQRSGVAGRAFKHLLPLPRPCARRWQHMARASVGPEPSEEGPQKQQEEAAPEVQRGERWQPASLLSGWKGPATLLLSLSAVSGGGLLGSNFDLQGPGSVAQALGVLALTVTVHELGHFLAARLQNIHVTKFAVGFGPTLLKFQGGEVEYSVRALPLGGFVAFPDDEPDSKYPADDPDLLRNRPVKDRIIVVCAGVVANMVFALATCITQANTVGVQQAKYFPGVVVGSVNEGAVAQLAGLQKGDILLDISGMPVAPSPSSVSQVVNKISVNPKRPLEFTVERQGDLVKVPITPAEMPDGTGRIGIALGPNAEISRKKANDFVEAAWLGAKEMVDLTGGVVKGLSQFFTNFKQTSEQVSGPVAILAVGAEVARRDISGLYQFCALININLAVVNILPLPALDGGYLVFLLYEALRGKKVDQAVERGIMASGLLLLMTFGMFLIVKDTLSLTGIVQ